MPLLLALLLLVLPAGASAVERHAAPGGVGSPTECFALAPCSLTDALSNAYLADGDEVILAPGTYSVSTDLWLSKAVLVRGGGGTAATAIESNGTTDGFVVTNANAELRDFELRHNAGAGDGLVLNSGTLERMIIKSSVRDACVYNDGTIRDTVCASSANFGSGIKGNYGGGTSVNLTLRNVTAIGSGAMNSRGINFYAADTSGISLVGMSVIARGTTDDIYVAKTIGADLGLALSYSNFSDVTIQGDGLATVTSPTLYGNQTTAPIFVDAPGGNYHQAAGSPTIDAGSYDLSSGITDIDGQARPSGAAYDIGADEYYAPPSPGPGPSPSPLPPADTTPPAGKITKKPKKQTSSRTAKFKFNSSEAGSTFRCKLDRGKYKPCKASYSKRVKPGKHTLRVVAVDAAGNSDPTPAVWRWRVTSS